MLRFALCCLLIASALPAQAEGGGRVDYTLSPVMQRDSLDTLLVEVAFEADGSGRTVLELPDSYGGVKEHYRYIDQISLSGGTISAPTPAERVVVSKPKAKLLIRYMVRGAYKKDPDSAGGNAYDGAVVRPDWFASLGELILATPKGRENDTATVNWKHWPKGWKTIASSDGHFNTVDELVGTSFLAGPHVELRTRAIAGGHLRFASHGRIALNLDSYADRVASVVSAQRKFWGKTNGDYTVTLLALAPSPNISSTGGTGRTFGFVLYASPDTDESTLFRIIAHEHNHNWLPRQLGTMPANDALAFWLSEGFTDFYTSRTLLQSRLWTPKQFVDNLNLTLVRLAGSPARTYPNERIGRDFWSDAAVEQLPYDRGHLFALLLDSTLRRAGKPRLDSVIFEMRDRWLAAPANAKPEIVANLLAVLDARGYDLRPLLKQYINDGDAIELPADLFGPCNPVTWAMLPNFDVGFDRDASAKAGSFAGVDPRGAAYAAGLRDGMKRIARVTGEEGNSAALLSYKVQDGAIQRTLSWFPAGRKRIRVQQASFAPIEATDRGKCLSGTSFDVR